MKLHTDARERIRACLIEGLPHLLLKNGIFLDSVSRFVCLYKANEVLSKRGPEKELLNDWIGDFPLIEFCSDFIAYDLSLHGTYASGDVLFPITELPRYAAIDLVADWLVEQFESLPWTYALTLELPPSHLPPLPKASTRMAVLDGSALIATNLLLETEFPLRANSRLLERMRGPGALALLGPPDPLKWASDAAFFQTQVEGFIGPYGGTTPMDVATARLKAFFGLGLAMHLFSHEYKYDPYPTTKSWKLHRLFDGGWELHDKLDLDLEDSRVLGAITLWDQFNDQYPQEHKVPWLQSLLQRISTALVAPGSKSVNLAARWYFDSFKGNDEILRYVRRMTTLEIILGEGADTSKASLGELLGNRLAYLIGKTHKERADVLLSFKRIYNVRSGILHRGKHRLTSDERGLLNQLQRLCERALTEEARLLCASSEEK